MSDTRTGWQRIPNSRDDWRFTPTSAAGATVGALVAAGTLGDAAGIPAWWVWPASALVLAAAVAAWHGRHLARHSLTLRLLLWAGGTVWLWQALTVSPWRPGMLGGLAVGAVAAVVGAPALSRADQRAETLAAAQDEVKKRDQLGAQWEARLHKAGAGGAKVIGIEQWDRRDIGGEQVIPGYTIEIHNGEHTTDAIAAITPKLGTLAALPRGAGVEVLEGVDQAHSLLKVATVDTLAEDLAWEHGPESSINEPMVIGRYRDASDVLAHVRERTMLLCGPKRRGKSTTLHGLIGRMLEQNDHLLFGIDLSGGDLLRPWMAPWLAGETERPPFDWVAADVEEAILLATAIRDIGRARKGLTAQIRMQADAMLTPLSPTLPRLTILTDEGEMVGGQDAGPRERHLGRILLDIVKELGNPGCDVVFCSLRPVGTSLLGGTDLRAQVRVKMQTGVDDVAEAGYMFGTHRGLVVADTARPGRLWIGIDGADPRPYVAPHVTPSIIREIAVRTDAWRPALDDASAAIAGEAYATRWDRAGWLHDTSGSGTAVAVAPAPPAPVSTGGGDSAGPAGGMAQGVADLEASIAALHAENAAAAGSPQPDAAADDDLAKLAGALAATEAVESAAPRLAAAGDRRGAALALLRAAGREGAGATVLRDRLAALLADIGDTTTPTSRQTVHGWLRAEHAARRIWRRPGGTYVHGDWPKPADAEAPDGGDGE